VRSFCLGVAFLLSFPTLAATAAENEVFSVASFAVALDASGQKAASAAHALLNRRMETAQGLRRIEPARVFSGDPPTEEEQTLERAKSALQQGKLDYQAFELDDTITRMTQSINLFQKATPLLWDLGGLQSALTYLGAALTLRGSVDEAEKAFLEILTVNPSYQLFDFPPPVLRVFEKAVARLETVPSGSMEIFSTPPYAAVFLDGKFQGTAPLVLTDIVAGRHYLHLERLGYTVFGTAVDVSPGQRVTMQTQLKSIRRGAELRDLTKRSALEAKDELMGGATRTLAQTLKADLVVMIAVSQSGNNATFVGSIFDSASGTRIHGEQIVLPPSAPTFPQDLSAFIESLVKSASPEDAGAAADKSGPGIASGASLLGVAPATNPPEATAATEPHDNRDADFYWGWSLSGVGMAGILAGVGLGIVAADKQSEFDRTPQGSPDLDGIRSAGKDFALAADISYIIGGAALIAGGILLYLHYTEEPTPEELLREQQARWLAPPAVDYQALRSPIPLGGSL
jgi:tetratricopeptide (TPR) repeat protein